MFSDLIIKINIINPMKCYIIIISSHTMNKNNSMNYNTVHKKIYSIIPNKKNYSQKKDQE